MHFSTPDLHVATAHLFDVTARQDCSCACWHRTPHEVTAFEILRRAAGILRYFVRSSSAFAFIALSVVFHRYIVVLQTFNLVHGVFQRGFRGLFSASFILFSNLCSRLVLLRAASRRRDSVSESSAFFGVVSFAWLSLDIVFVGMFFPVIVVVLSSFLIASFGIYDGG